MVFGNTDKMLTKEKEILFRLIEAYKDMPYLWDKRHRNYRNQELRKEGNKILYEIYKEFDIHATVRSVVKKIQNLRTTFFKELRKVKRSIRSGAENVYIPTLWYFEAMSFLESESACQDINGLEDDTEIDIKKGNPSILAKELVKGSIRAEADKVFIPTLWYVDAMSFPASEPPSQQQTNNIKIEITADNEDRSRLSDMQTTEYDENSSSSSHRNEPIHVIPMKKKRVKKERIKKEVEDTYRMDTEIKITPEMPKEEDNECELYCELLARRLKKIDEDQRLVLMNEIDNLVFKAVMNCKAREPSSVFFSMVDTNLETEEG